MKLLFPVKPFLTVSPVSNTLNFAPPGMNPLVAGVGAAGGVSVASDQGWAHSSSADPEGMSGPEPKPVSLRNGFVTVPHTAASHSLELLPCRTHEAHKGVHML